MRRTGSHKIDLQYSRLEEIKVDIMILRNIQASTKLTSVRKALQNLIDVLKRQRVAIKKEMS